MKKLATFILVGVGGAIIDYGSRSFFISFGLAFSLSRALSYVLGSASTYYVNSRMTFSGRRSAREMSRATVV